MRHLAFFRRVFFETLRHSDSFHHHQTKYLCHVSHISDQNDKWQLNGIERATPFPMFRHQGDTVSYAGLAVQVVSR